MFDAHAFSLEKSGVRRGIAAGAAVTLVALTLAWNAPEAMVPAGDLSSRLRAGTLSALVPIVVVALHVGDIARRRFRSADAIEGAAVDLPGSPLAAAKALFANTCEQSLLAVPTYWALAICLPTERLAVVVALAALFASGRVAFIMRYRSGAAARSFGFALTFYPTLAGIILAFAVGLG